jgi:hypothetical protein
MKVLLAGAALCACALALALESPPPYGAGSALKGKPAQQSANLQIDTSSLERAMRDAIKDASERESPNEQRHLINEGKIADETAELAVETKALARYTFYVLLATAALAVVAAGQLLMFSWQLRLMEDSSGDTKTLANAAESNAQTAKLNAEAVMAAERPWLVISFQPPGLDVFNDHMARVSIAIRNAGRTPASVSDIGVEFSLREFDDPLPEDFTAKFSDRDERAKRKLYLVGGDSAPFVKHMSYRDQTRTNVQNSEKRLWVFAWVDYMDAFGQRHRFQTARIYETALGDGSKTEDKLNFMHPDGVYTRDHLRNVGEGFDWPQQRVDRNAGHEHA